ncbi:MAG: hypothetical protein HQ567_10445 [Candidatus Nealsonbacteria bacterium]|nr:hypothetical protein [Candidatus Nealsonbacteria bacterium]
MHTRALIAYPLLAAACCLGPAGCCGPKCGDPPYDRPFPLGQVTDAFWETQQTNAEAADFIFYDHEFVGETAELTAGGRSHLLQMALRLPHVPFPVVVEQSVGDTKTQLDQERRETVVGTLIDIGVSNAEPRVVIAPAVPQGVTAMEGESAYYRTLDSNTFENGGGVGRRFNGRGGTWR